MKMKYLAWIFVPAMAFGLAACDNAGNEGAGDMSSPAPSDSASGSGIDTQPYGGTGSSGETQSSQQDTTMPPASGGTGSG